MLSSVPSGMGSEAQVNQGSNTYRAFGLETAAHTTSTGITGKIVDCGTGAVGGCPAGVAGNVALIQRGTNTFAEKITNAKNQGAVGAIIYQRRR